MGSQKEKQSEFVANGEIKQFVISKTHNCASKLEDGAYESWWKHNKGTEKLTKARTLWKWYSWTWAISNSEMSY